MINACVYLFFFSLLIDSHSSNTESHRDRVHALTTRSQLSLFFLSSFIHLHLYIVYKLLKCLHFDVISLC